MRALPDILKKTFLKTLKKQPIKIISQYYEAQLAFVNMRFVSLTDEPIILSMQQCQYQLPIMLECESADN